MKAKFALPFATLLTGLVFMTSASAGCANYTDGSLDEPAPEVLICFKEACDLTTMTHECANVRGALIGYAIGWEVSSTIDPSGVTESEIRWQGNPITPEKYEHISCRDMDPDTFGCRFPGPAVNIAFSDASAPKKTGLSRSNTDFERVKN